MRKADFKELLNRYLNDSLSVEELQELLAHLQKQENTETLQQIIQQALQDNTFRNLADKTRTDIIFRKLMQQARNEQGTDNSPPRKKLFILLPWLATAAAVLAGVFLVTWLVFIKEAPPQKLVLSHTTPPGDVAPGGNKAFLQLADGSVITLDDTDTGMLAQQGPARVIKLDNGRLQYNSTSAQDAATLYNTITTPRGGQYHVILPDGSKVWLNAASSLRFPTVFAGRERSVQLTGEAYFEIAHNKSMPFHVQVNEIRVEVLGTHFNVMSYENESAVATTLLQGSVRVAGNTMYMPVVLKPGQQASLQRQSAQGFSVHDVDTESVIAWKNGLFQFNSADIQTIMRQLERWYDVRVQYKGPIPEGHYSGIVPRDNNLLKVLRILEESDLKFAIEGKKLYVL
jgi:Fe2+-dicitrate sensor, membrane component